MKQKDSDTLYMDIATRVSKESKCPRKQVGAVVVTQSNAMFPGFNGHASGGPNEWEDTGEPNLEVVHAEHNCLGKMLEEGISAKGATIYTTLSCCMQCSKLVVRAGIKRVVYKEEYRDASGIEYLKRYGVEVEKFEELENKNNFDGGFSDSNIDKLLRNNSTSAKYATEVHHVWHFIGEKDKAN